MAQLTADERLAKIKIARYGTALHNFTDEQLKIYIDEVIEYLVDGGVKREVAESTAAVGCIACGVNDILNYSSGEVKYSEYFNQRLIQLSMKQGDSNVQTE